MSLYHLSYVDGSGRGHYAASPAFDDLNTPLLSQHPFIASYAALTPSHPAADPAADEEREEEQPLTDDAHGKHESLPLLPSRDGRQQLQHQQQQQQQQQQQPSSTFILRASPSHSRRSRSDFHSGMRHEPNSHTQLSQQQQQPKQTLQQQTAATAAALGDKLKPEAWRRGHPAVIPVSPSLSSSLRPADATVTSYESPVSGLSSYHSDYSSPFSPPVPSSPSPSPLLLRVLASSLSSLLTVLRWPCSHPEHSLLLFLSLCIVASSSMEQTLRKTLTSSLYNYRAALFLASAFVSCLLSCSLCALQRTQLKSQQLQQSMPLLPLLLLMLLDSCHCLFLFLSMAVLPAPLALLLPQLMLPCTLISSALLQSRQMERAPLLGCVLVLLSLALATVSTVHSLPVSSSDAFVLSTRELWCNIVLMLVATLAATASYHCKHRLLCRHSMQPQLLNAIIAAGQLVLAVIVVPLAIRMQYLGTNRYSEAGGGGEAALPPALPVGAGAGSNSSSSTAQPSRSSAGPVPISSSPASRTSSLLASLSSSDVSASSLSSASSSSPAAADVSTAVATAAQTATSVSSSAIDSSSSPSSADISS
jgi:hypothetical protein